MLKLSADSWDMAHQVCSHRGHLLQPVAVLCCVLISCLGSIPVSGGHFSPGDDSILLDDLECDGSEQTLLNCTYSQTHNCDHSEDAGVRCQGRGQDHLESSHLVFL